MSIVNPALNDLQKQYEEEQDLQKKKEIRKVYLRALDETEKITQKIIDDNTQKYNDAIAELEKANAELKKARKELGDFADSVKKVAKAVNMLAELAALAT